MIFFFLKERSIDIHITTFSFHCSPRVAAFMSEWEKVLTKQWRTKPEGKSILCRLRNVESLANTAAQLLHTDTAKPFYC